MADRLPANAQLFVKLHEGVAFLVGPFAGAKAGLGIEPLPVTGNEGHTPLVVYF